VGAPNLGAPFIFQHIELPPVPPLVIEYRLHERCCSACGGVTRGQLPGDVGPSPYGPRLQDLVVTWAIQLHLSRRQIQRLLASLYGLTMCIGTIQSIIERVAAACKAPVADLKAAIGNAPFANADETGHMHQGGGAKGKRHWLWVAVTMWGAVFAAAADRGQAGLELVLGKDYNPPCRTPAVKRRLGCVRDSAIVGCDRWRPYESFYGENRQLCWAHLKREGQAAIDQAEFMLKSKDAVLRFDGERLMAWGRAFMSLFKAMFASWHRFRSGECGRAGLCCAVVSHKAAFDGLFLRGLTVERKKVKAMCKDLLRPVQWTALWRFVTVPGVEPTNNAAEQALRQSVLIRRKSGGTRSETGMKALATLLSVVETCRRQGRSAIDYLEAVIRSQHLELRPPSLVPA
jgi:transposase